MIYACVSSISCLNSWSSFLIPLMLTCNMIIFISFYCYICVIVWCLLSCGRLWSVCVFVVGPYVDVVVSVTVMRVLHVSILIECDGA